MRSNPGYRKFTRVTNGFTFLLPGLEPGRIRQNPVLTRLEPGLRVPQTCSFFIGWLAEGRWPTVCSGGHALGAVFNQLVRSRAQLLVAE